MTACAIRAIRAVVDRIFRRENIANGALHRWTLLRGPAGRCTCTISAAPTRARCTTTPSASPRSCCGAAMSRKPRTRPRCRRRRQFRAPCVRSFEASHLHRIRPLPGGCWTLVLVGPKVREWGFVHNDEWIHWRRWHEVYDERGGC